MAVTGGDPHIRRTSGEPLRSDVLSSSRTALKYVGREPVVRAVFLDKDGTLVRDVPYNVDPSRVEFYPDVTALLRLKQAGFRLFIVSNQSGVARGLASEDTVQRMFFYLLGRLFVEGVIIDGYEYCLHHPEAQVARYRLACYCRKPAPGMLLSMAERYGIDLAESWMVGDIMDDIEAGRRAGCRTVLVDRGNETGWQTGKLRTPERYVTSLQEAVDAILTARGGQHEPYHYPSTELFTA